MGIKNGRGGNSDIYRLVNLTLIEVKQDRKTQTCLIKK